MVNVEKKGRERSDLFELPAPKFYKALSKLPKNQDGGTNATTLCLVMARQAGLNTTKTTETDMVRTDRPVSPILAYRFEHERVKRAFEQCVEGLAACNILFPHSDRVTGFVLEGVLCLVSLDRRTS